MFLMFNTAEGELECDYAIGMKQLGAVRDGNVDRLARSSWNVQCFNETFVNEVYRGTGV